jgi:hypothetical protein
METTFKNGGIILNHLKLTLYVNVKTSTISNKTWLAVWSGNPKQHFETCFPVKNTLESVKRNPNMSTEDTVNCLCFSPYRNLLVHSSVFHSLYINVLFVSSHLCSLQLQLQHLYPFPWMRMATQVFSRHIFTVITFCQLLCHFLVQQIILFHMEMRT